MLKLAIATGTMIVTLAGMTFPAAAQDGREAQLIGFHTLCNRGDRGACVKFGMMLQQNSDHHAEWRRTHPEFFFFER